MGWGLQLRPPCLCLDPRVGGAAPLLGRGGRPARSCIHTRGAWLAGRSETPPQHAPAACAGQG